MSTRAIVIGLAVALVLAGSLLLTLNPALRCEATFGDWRTETTGYRHVPARGAYPAVDVPVTEDVCRY